MSLPQGPVPPFDDAAGGEWLRCALHVHTTASDGWLTPEAQRRYHAWAGYDVLMLTDHDQLTPAPAGEEDLLVIGGAELSLRAPVSGGPLHVLALGITEQPAVDQTATLAEAALAIRAAGGLPFVAHPVWSGLRPDEVAGIEHCAGVEIFNASCQVEQDRGHNDAHADIWLSEGKRLTLLATDDTHYPGFDAFQAWTMVRAAARTREAVLDALAAGWFYASSGPKLTGITIEGMTLTVRSSPVRSVALLANPPYGAQVTAGWQTMAYRGQRLPAADGQGPEGLVEGELLTGARFAWRPGMRYVRVVVTDAQGRRAWSNPIWAE